MSFRQAFNVPANYVPMRIKEAMRQSKRAESETVKDAKARANDAARKYAELLAIVNDKQYRGVRVYKTTLAELGRLREEMLLRQDELDRALAGRLHFYRALPQN